MKKGKKTTKLYAKLQKIINGEYFNSYINYNNIN